MNYEDMLKKGMDEVPDSVKHQERFEIPKVKGRVEGNKTIIINFHQIAQALGRDIDHFLKFVLKSLATPGDLQKNRLVLGRKISSSLINEKIQKYAEEFVICKECGKADSKIVKKDKIFFVRCLACGAQHPIQSKI